MEYLLFFLNMQSEETLSKIDHGKEIHRGLARQPTDISFNKLRYLTKGLSKGNTYLPYLNRKLRSQECGISGVQ